MRLGRCPSWLVTRAHTHFLRPVSPRLLEIAPATKGSKDAGSRNLFKVICVAFWKPELHLHFTKPIRLTLKSSGDGVPLHTLGKKYIVLLGLIQLCHLWISAIYAYWAGPFILLSPFYIRQRKSSESGLKYE